MIEFENKLFCEDNLELLNRLPDKCIDLIYCDILYGTGRNFKDYKDLPAKRDIIEAFYIPRIEQMHRVLKDTGSIYLQMDTRINHWVRCILDDVFGYGNFRNEIVWCYRNCPNRGNKFSDQKNHILFYTKQKEFLWNQLFEPLAKDTIKKHGNKKRDFVKSRSDKKYDNSETNINGTYMRDWWFIVPLSGNDTEICGYYSQKPKALLERIIKASSNEGDLVADFFCGSGTAGVVAKELGRNYLLCDINPRAIEISNKRLLETMPLFG